MRFWLDFLWLAGLSSLVWTGTSAVADAIDLHDRLIPGGILIGEAPPGSKIWVDGRTVRQAEDGRFVFGAGRDAEGGIEVIIDCPDGSHVKRQVKIERRDYDVQRINGLPPRKVEPNKEDQKKIEADWIVLNGTKEQDSQELGFIGPASWPVTGPLSGVFGSQRILNGKPKSPHRGVDIAAATGTPVKAMLDGVVTVAKADMYYTGGTVMVDHGHGIQSLYAHLSEVSVEVGQRLDQGDRLGRIGATGRVTGPHLHLSLYWFKTALDPALILGPMPNGT